MTCFKYVFTRNKKIMLIRVTDVNDNAPVFVSSPYYLNIRNIIKLNIVEPYSSAHFANRYCSMLFLPEPFSFLVFICHPKNNYQTRNQKDLSRLVIFDRVILFFKVPSNTAEILSNTYTIKILETPAELILDQQIF